MITGDLKSKIDKVWDAFWTGGISNPLTVIEQITYLLFIKRLDDLHTAKELKANTLKQPLENPIFSGKQQHLRWSRFKDKDAEQMYEIVGKEAFDFMKSMANADSPFAKYMKGATFMIPTPNLLDKVVNMISEIPMQDRDTKGDLYEYLLSKIATAGKNGQFRTPRHIIKMMVALMKPSPEDTVFDPACGTGGFLVATGEYMREKYPEKFHNKTFREYYNNSMFIGNEFDATMIRIGAMNMLLHGIENPTLYDRDSLAESYTVKSQYSLILANPPFKGSLDEESVEKSLLKMVKTKKTELLFLALMLRTLKTGGRCAVIVPDGVLFGSSNAHAAIRKEIIDNQKLEAVISMPSGVFKPYAGVSTAVLIFTKTTSGGTDDVWFYDMKADGYTLDDKRNPIEQNDIPDIIARYANRVQEKQRKRTDRSFLVPVEEIRDNKYDLSINRYKEIIYEEKQYDSPVQIIADIRDLDKQRTAELDTLENLLKQ